MVGSRRLEPKSPAKPPAEGAGHCRAGAGVLAGLPEGLPSCSRVLGGKSPWSEDLFPYGFPDAQGVWWLPLCRKEGWILPQRVNEVKKEGRV